MIESTNSRQVFYGDGIGTEFEFDIHYLNESDIIVRVYDEGTELTAPYSISLPQDDERKVTFDTAPADGTRIVVMRSVTFTQLQNFDNAGPFYASDHENALDTAVHRAQDIQDALGRSLKLDISEDTVSQEVGRGIGNNPSAALVMTDDGVFEFVGDANAALVAQEQKELAESYVAPAAANASDASDAADSAAGSATDAGDYYDLMVGQTSGRALSVGDEVTISTSLTVGEITPVGDYVEGQTLTLTAPTSPATGSMFGVKNARARWRDILIDPGAATIDGASGTYSVRFPYEFEKFMYDGAGNWMTLGGHGGALTPHPVMEWADGTTVNINPQILHSDVFSVKMTDGSIRRSETIAMDLTGLTDTTGVTHAYLYVYLVPSGTTGMTWAVSSQQPGALTALPISKYVGALLLRDSTVSKFSQSGNRFRIGDHYDEFFEIRTPTAMGSSDHQIATNAPVTADQVIVKASIGSQSPIATDYELTIGETNTGESERPILVGNGRNGQIDLGQFLAPNVTGNIHARTPNEHNSTTPWFAMSLAGWRDKWVY